MDEQSRQEIEADMKDLAAIAASAEARLAACQKRRSTPADPMMQALQTELAHTRSALEKPGTASLDALIEKKFAAIRRLRELQGVLGAVLAAADWQSPSFLSAGHSQAGSQAGLIKGTVNDYKRDHHIDANAYEKAWRSAYLDIPALMNPTVYVTSSGMAAFATVVNGIMMKTAQHDVFLAGTSCYFENKKVLMRLLGARVHFVNDADASTFIDAVKRLKPKAVFLDSLCNSPDVTMPDVAAIVKAVGTIKKDLTYIVIDNTGLASRGQFLHLVPRIWSHIELIGIESLNKYHQFGFDRVTGGVIWTAPHSHINLFQVRMHLGTNMPDASVLAMPMPDRAMLERRLKRFERNATHIATRLQAHIESDSDTGVDHVVFPGLPNHPAYERTKRLAFHGSCLVLAFKPAQQTVATYKTFLERAINAAKTEGIELNAGTSFGFDTTRVYLTALNAKEAEKPFVRISVGTECMMEIERIARILIQALP